MFLPIAVVVSIEDVRRADAARPHHKRVAITSGRDPKLVREIEIALGQCLVLGPPVGVVPGGRVKT